MLTDRLVGSLSAMVLIYFFPYFYPFFLRLFYSDNMPKIRCFFVYPSMESIDFDYYQIN